MKIIRYMILPALMLSIIFPGITSAQQKGTVTGKITMEDGTTLPGVMVWIKRTDISTVTNTKGVFTLTGLTPGTTSICAALQTLKTKRSLFSSLLEKQSF